MNFKRTPMPLPSLGQALLHLLTFSQLGLVALMLVNKSQQNKANSTGFSLFSGLSGAKPEHLSFQSRNFLTKYGVIWIRTVDRGLNFGPSVA